MPSVQHLSHVNAGAYPVSDRLQDHLNRIVAGRGWYKRTQSFGGCRCASRLQMVPWSTREAASAREEKRPWWVTRHRWNLWLNPMAMRGFVLHAAGSALSNVDVTLAISARMVPKGAGRLMQSFISS